MVKYWQRGHIKAHEQAALDMPVGDAFSGPAFGDRHDVGTVTGALGLNAGAAKLQSDAAGRASKRAENAANAANQLERDQWEKAQADNQPLLDMRNALLPRVQSLASQDVSLNPADVMAEPGYQFGLKSGLTSLQSTAAGKGGLYSGATLKALSRYGNDYASTKYNDAWNRQQTGLTNSLNRALSGASLGQQGANNLMQAGQAYTTNTSNNLFNSANVQNAATMSQANIWGNLLNRASSYAGGM